MQHGKGPAGRHRDAQRMMECRQPVRAQVGGMKNVLHDQQQERPLPVISA